MSVNAELLPGDGKLHLRESDLDVVAEQVIIATRQIVDGCGLKVFVRIDQAKARSMTFDLLAGLTKDAGKGQPHYDLVLGGIQ